MEWFFNGFGTQIVFFIFGSIFGVAGHTFYIKQRNRNKQSQRAGEGSIQIQNNGAYANEGNISADKVSGDQYSPKGDYIVGNKIISSETEELDIRNFSHYSNTQIEDVIAKGNDATIRKWCLELIINGKQDYLIMSCIEKMNNDREKCKLLEELSKRKFEDSKYFAILNNSLTNGVYQVEAIKLLVSINNAEYIKAVFVRITNNKYIFDSLIVIYAYDKELFEMLYNDGKCFDNQQYKVKMMEWLKNNSNM